MKKQRIESIHKVNNQSARRERILDVLEKALGQRWGELADAILELDGAGAERERREGTPEVANVVIVLNVIMWGLILAWMWGGIYLPLPR